MLICMMYHHINSDRFSNNNDTFESHLKYILENFNIVVPGDKLSSKKPNICLVFDDAYYDFYYFVFPLLKKYTIKVMLSVPVKYILEDTDLPNNKRLSIKHSDTMKNSNYIKYAPFCTWREINEMVDSDLIRITSHSFSHIDLTKQDTDLDLELRKSKEIIEGKINRSIDSFTFPYGQFNEKIKFVAIKYYKFLFGIGGIDNKTWDGFNRILYRIYGDDLKHFSDKLRKTSLLFYKLRRLKWQIEKI